MQCMVGTPGRVLDMIGKRHFRVDFLGFVLDAADHMLSRGFKNQIYDMFFKTLPPNIEVCILSATMPPDIWI